MRRTGFTLIEVMIVTVVLALMAGLVVPRLVAFRSSERVMRDVQTIETFAAETRQRAMTGKQTYLLTFDEQTSTLSSDIADTTSAPATGTSSDSTAKEKKLTSTWTISDVTNPAETTTTTSDLSVKFFADGTAEARTATFTQDGVAYGMTISKEGILKLKRGAVASTDPTEWEAGNLEQRTN